MDEKRSFSKKLLYNSSKNMVELTVILISELDILISCVNALHSIQEML